MDQSFDKLIYISHTESYHHYTCSFAVRRLAQMLGVKCLAYHYRDNWKKIDNARNIVLLDGFLFTTFKELGGAEFYRKLFPNSYLVVFASDTVNRTNYIDYSSPELIDLHLDTSDKVVKEYQQRGYNAKLFIWSAAGMMHEYLSGFTPYIDFEAKTNDIVFLANIKPNYTVRKSFIAAIQQYYKVQYNLRVQHIDDIALLYKYSWVSLGSTTPSYDWDRNGKGFRDWLSPGCGTVLIHDDWEPYKEIFDGVVPMYEYGDSSSLVVIMENLKKDQKMYNHYWQQQNRWIEQNTIEQQIYRAIKDEKVLCCL